MKQSTLSTGRQFALAAIALASLISAPGQVKSQRRPSAGRLADSNNGGFRSPCGTAEQVAQRVGLCMEPILELIQGRFAAPKGDADVVAVCDRFSNTEKCIRTLSKDCLSGLHKTTVGSFASASKRFRNSECKTPAARAKNMDPLQCLIKKEAELVPMFKNFTAMAQGVRDLPIMAEEKLVKICCLLIAMDKGIEESFNKDCAKSTSQVISIVHSITDDARKTLCVNPKCQGALSKVTGRTYRAPQNFVETTSQILFMLSVD